jgi:uncharacterized SAM-binding protein YcdF (DUF218 family)
MDSIVLLKFLGNAALPPTSMVLGLVVAAVLALLGWKKVARGVAGLAVLETALLSLPPVGDLLMGPLEREARLAAAKAPACCYEAIVVLGGGVKPAVQPWQPAPDLGPAADRVWLAARLYRQGLAPKIIVSGGTILSQYGGVPTTSSEAAAMTEFLTDLGVPESSIISEGQAINTRDNIQRVRALVQDKPVALVTSAYHMPRAMRLAAWGGLNAMAFPTDWEAPWPARPYWENWLPSHAAQGVSATAIWEYLALALDYRAGGITK